MPNKVLDVVSEKIYRDALEAANQVRDSHQEHSYCGFAWVTIRPARGPFVKYLKQKDIGRRDDYAGGYKLWTGEYCTDYYGQSMDKKEAMAAAFVKVLRDNGINANVGSRAD